MVEVKWIFTLLVVFQMKQFSADFLLQTPYMLQKTRRGWDFLPPLLLHVAVHGAFTFFICLYFAPAFLWLAGVDFAAHFTMDRMKVGPRYLGRFNDPSRGSYWYCYGFDQMVHHLTHYFIIWTIVGG